MGRAARIDMPGIPQHVIVRGNNRNELFRDDADRHIFLKFLQQGLELTACELHAYVLMSNHVHLLATGHAPGELSALMHRLSGLFARVMNLRWGRSGTLFEGRFRSSLVDSEAYLLTCMRYIELNPVRAGMVRAPGDYFWSSYRDNASGDPPPPLFAHPLYRRLGSTPAVRSIEYRRLFRSGVTEEDLTRIRLSARQSRALGSEEFCARMSQLIQHDVTPVPQGRPRKGDRDEMVPVPRRG
jgi:putative transposase